MVNTLIVVTPNIAFREVKIIPFTLVWLQNVVIYMYVLFIIIYVCYSYMCIIYVCVSLYETIGMLITCIGSYWPIGNAIMQGL